MVKIDLFETKMSSFMVNFNIDYIVSIKMYFYPIEQLDAKYNQNLWK